MLQIDNKKENDGLGEEIDLYKFYCSNTLFYRKNTCQGFLKKQPENPNFWQGSITYKRYFILNHLKKVLQIYKIEENKTEVETKLKHERYILMAQKADPTQLTVIAY